MPCFCASAYIYTHTNTQMLTCLGKTGGGYVHMYINTHTKLKNFFPFSCFPVLFFFFLMPFTVDRIFYAIFY